MELHLRGKIPICYMTVVNETYSAGFAFERAPLPCLPSCAPFYIRKFCDDMRRRYVATAILCICIFYVLLSSSRDRGNVNISGSGVVIGPSRQAVYNATPISDSTFSPGTPMLNVRTEDAPWGAASTGPSVWRVQLQSSTSTRLLRKACTGQPNCSPIYC